MKQARKGLSAPMLRIILSVCLVFTTIISIAIGYFANNHLSEYTSDIRKVIIDSKGSDENNANIDSLERQLKVNKDTSSRAAQIVADSQSYKYQNEIIRDIKTYAEANRVDIASVAFVAEQSNASASRSATDPKTTTTINGVKPTTVTVTLAHEAAYADALGFVRAIEQNLTKMQISSLGLSTAKPGSPSGSVRIDTINLEVYLKS